MTRLGVCDVLNLSRNGKPRICAGVIFSTVKRQLPQKERVWNGCGMALEKGFRAGCKGIPLRL